VTSHHEHLAPGANSDDDAWKLFVFRKNRELLPTRDLLDDLQSEIQSLGHGNGSVIDTLVRAGEIETGLEDNGSPAATRLSGLVDELAAAACAGRLPSPGCLHSLNADADALDCPSSIRCSHPEGFSYYGLNPLDFADLATRIAPGLARRVAVIGIRSVGSTLGAVVAATLRVNGRTAGRITVRPEGEPYHRKTTFTMAQMSWIHAQMEQLADFVVVDEGPGFSGSTFLSVARALLEAGVPRSRVVLLGSRPFPPHAPAAQVDEWTRFRSHLVDYGAHAPHDAGRGLGGGAWRELIYTDPSHWPASWTDQERIKHLSGDGMIFFKFEGFGRFGKLARTQAEALDQAGLSPRLQRWDIGFGGYEFLQGRPLRSDDLTPDLLARMAAYCAFRIGNFPAPDSGTALLQEMMRVNLEVEFDRQLQVEELHAERPIYADCRMLPHEWFLSPQGGILKTDSVGHSEGHQLPGPVDIAWDLAGAIVEWGLSPAQTDFFLSAYQRQSGDNPRSRLHGYLLAYSVLRAAQCRMAAASAGSALDAHALLNTYRVHRTRVLGLLEDRKAQSVDCLPSDAGSQA
jgi:hypothetical protein